MQPTSQLSAIVPALSELVDRIDPADLHRPTPCERFDVRDVLDHMIVLGGSFAAVFRGEQPTERTAPEDDGRVPIAAFRATMDDLLAAVLADGSMARIVVTPMGEMPGETFARLVAIDGVVHGWDLSRATGLGYDLHTEVVDAVDRFARQALTDDLRDGDTFKAPTTPPTDATPVERLAAFTGRAV